MTSSIAHRRVALIFSLSLATFLTAPANSAELPYPALTDPEIRDWIYAGGDLGYANVGVSHTLRESDKNGYQLNLKLLYSKYIGAWVFDLGGGWMYNKISGKDENSTRVDPRVKVITRAGFLELSPRYRFDKNWQVGAVVNALVGTDVSFDESTTRGDEPFHVLIGPRADYELPALYGRWRFGAQIMTDLTIGNRQIWLAQADVQYGIPFGEAKSSSPAPVEEVAAPPARPRAPPLAELAEESSVKIYLGEAVLRFRTARFDLRPSSHEILAKVVSYLKKSQSAWQSMRVEGHTDIRGRLAYNEWLAVQRAQSVKKELVQLGLPASKLSVKGFGPNKPIDPANDLDAYALNRRVELWLEGVSQPDVIIRELNEMN